MIVPQFWAEARIQQQRPQKRITVRRFGWSDVSQEEAQAHADSRAREAFDRIAAGETLRRREPRVPYSGADGVPIREEILSRHGDTIITRNCYGAACLNTPDVAFADVDKDIPWTARGCMLLFLVLAAAAGWFGCETGKWLLTAGLFIAAIVASAVISRTIEWLVIRLRGGEESIARRRIDCFIKNHPGWRIRLYRTPAGFRVLAMHSRFDPRSEEIAAFFKETGTDAQYAAMCRAQNCFRARLTPKPWRTGMKRRLLPRRRAWPVPPELLSQREEWVREYEIIAAEYAACQFIGEYGDGPVHEAARAVQQLHDNLCRAESSLPLA